MAAPPHRSPTVLTNAVGDDARIRVLIVDDHPLLRAGIASVLDAVDDVAIVAEAADGCEALAQFALHRPDVTLMDVQMPEMDGVTALSKIRRQWPHARIVILTTFPGHARALDALRAGAAGYLLKSMAHKELVDAIRSVHAGRRYVQHDIATELAQHLTDEPMSQRELEVLRHVAAGLSNKGVARELALSEGTVKSHMKNIMLKLAANDRTHAVTLALARGLIELKAGP